MKIKDIVRKLTSRKFLLALIAAVSGVITAFVGNGEAVTTIVGAAMTIIASVAYCIVEGRVDAKSVGQITEAAVDLAEELGAKEETVEAINKIGFAAEEMIEADGETESK